MKQLSLLFLLCLLYGTTVAQETTRVMGYADIFAKEGEDPFKYGRVEITEDIQIQNLLQKHIRLNPEVYVLKGYRIQIYFNSGYNAREEALRIKSEFEVLYPQIPTYLTHQTPFFKIRVGNFRTRVDALRFIRQIENEYKGSWIVEDKIEFPNL